MTHRTKILIIEDNEVISNVYGTLLKQWGYEVAISHAGYDGIEKAVGDGHSLVIMDIKLPDISGIEAAQLISSKKRVPILFLTGISDIEEVRPAIKKGAFGYLLKPVNPSQLRFSVLTSLERANEIKSLNRTINDAKVINAAIGMLMERHNIDYDIASEHLKKMARDNRLKLVDTSALIIMKSDLTVTHD